MVKIKEKRLYRSKNKILGGVSGGLAEYFETDPTIIRIIITLGSLIWGIGLIFYIAAWVIIPAHP